MSFTKKQLEDLETVEYFIPSVLKKVEITDEDRQMFLDWSERGVNGVGKCFIKVEQLICKNCGQYCEGVCYYKWISRKNFELVKILAFNCNNCNLKEKILTGALK